MDYAYKPTTHGRNAIAAYMALGTKPFNITRVAFGSGKVDEETNLADVHELLEYVANGAVAERGHKDDRLQLTIQFANSKHPDVKTFLLSEFIVYVEDPETGEETDLIYGTLGDYRQPVPAYNPAYPPSVFNFPLELILSDEINVNISAPAGLTTWDDIVQVAEKLAVRRMDVTIPATGWTQTGAGRYPYSLDIPVDGVTAQMIPDLTVLEEGGAAAIDCGLSQWVETLEGAVRVSAASVPSVPIPASLTLQGDASGFVLSGGDGGGGGVSDHRLLTQRDAADQHPISAITGLSEALESLAPVIVKVQLLGSGNSVLKSYNVKCYPAETAILSYSINFGLNGTTDGLPYGIKIIPPEQYAFTGLYGSSGVTLNIGAGFNTFGTIESDGTIGFGIPANAAGSFTPSWTITGSFTLEVA